MDYETLSNFFCGVFKHYKKEEYKVFVIHSKRDDRKAFIEFLEQNKKNREYHISFNGLGFDAQITHWFLDKKQAVLKADIEDLVRHIYDEAQDSKWGKHKI